MEQASKTGSQGYMLPENEFRAQVLKQSDAGQGFGGMTVIPRDVVSPGGHTSGQFTLLL